MIAEAIHRCRGCELPIGEGYPQGPDSGREPGHRDGRLFHQSCYDRPRTFYKVVHNNCDSCVWPTRAEADEDVEQNGESFFEENASENWRIDEVQMSWRQFVELGDHEGW